MRVLIQDLFSRYYLAGEKWVSDPLEATSFRSCTLALRFLAAGKLENVHVVMNFGENEHDISIPVSSRT
jgi:hypothetical protein